MSPVKGFVGDVWKMAVACASGAFLLSLVIGLVAGNPFGVVILRAFLLAVLFAGLGAGLRLVVKAYLPELAASSPADEAGRADAAVPGSAERAAEGGLGAAERRGAAVDILLPDDDGLRRQAYGGGGRPARGRQAEPGAAGDIEGGDEGLAASLGEDFMTQGDTPGLPELAEELDEELRRGAFAGGGRQPCWSAIGGGRSGGTGPGRGASAGHAGSPGRSRFSPRPRRAGCPGREACRPPRAAPAARGGETPEDAVRNALSGQDPSTLARAIRTVLKNEEKG